MARRIARMERTTAETEVVLEIDLDGSGITEIQTGIGFLDHMLESFCRHGFFDLNCDVNGDLLVDSHHTAEDTGIVIGQAIKEALGDKKGIRRFGHCIIPMDDVLALCAVDLGGRPYFSFDCEFTVPRIGAMDTELVKEFFYALTYNAGMNLHLKILAGENNHHKVEAMFKAFAKALDMAISYEERLSDEVMSTKGKL